MSTAGSKIKYHLNICIYLHINIEIQSSYNKDFSLESNSMKI